MPVNRWSEQMFWADFVKKEGDYELRQMKEICDETVEKGWWWGERDSKWKQNNNDWVPEDATVFFVGNIKMLQMTVWTMKWKDSEGNSRWLILDSPDIWLEGNEETHDKF
jgi:hypothetical protein